MYVISIENKYKKPFSMYTLSGVRRESWLWERERRSSLVRDLMTLGSGRHDSLLWSADNVCGERGEI